MGRALRPPGVAGTALLLTASAAGGAVAVKCSHRRQGAGGCSGPWPSLLLVGGGPDYAEILPTCWRILGGDLIWQAREQGSGGCRCGTLLEHTPCSAGP